MDILLFVIGLVVGGCSVWFIQKYRLESKSFSVEEKEQLESQLKELEEK